MTRDELITKMRAWLKRDSGVAPYDDFFELGQAKVLREIMPQPLDTSVVLDADAGVNVRAKVWAHQLPSDCLRVLALTNNNDRLRTARSDFLIDTLTSGSRPCNYAVVGGEVWVAPGVGSDLRLNYNAKDQAVSDGAGTNHGLTEFSDAYLWAGLAYGYAFTENADNEKRAWERYGALRDQINENADDRRRGGGAGRAT